ncbi:hypothetical protein Pint_16338 [Pistacia integerrima]|uniref:Uncharacterized protein n=1 Tax=Pistacia integerrima TaxID=434235 RepID=A0ACC0ZC39_9ROSI|nr:hypothetical protein Pint_16338 [Pistacia integerrima]
MLPTGSHSDDSIRFKWNFSTECVFGGLILLFVFITLLLLKLLLSHPKPVAPTPPSEPREKPQQLNLQIDNDVPEIVVIMAGEQNPSYIAKPAPSTQNSEQV